MEQVASCTAVGHLAHHAASQPALWNEVAARLAQQLGAQAVGIFEHDRAAGRGQIRYAAGIPEAYRSLYQARFAMRNPWLSAIGAASCPAPKAISGSDLLPNWELVRTDFYRAWLRPLGLLHGLLGILAHGHEATSALIALRPLDGAGFGSADRAAMTVLLRDLRCAWHLGAGFAAARSLAEVLLDLLAALPEAVIIVDREARPLVINRMGETLLERRDGLGISAGRIAAANPAETARLRRAIAAVTARDGETARAEAVLVRPSGGRPLLIRVEALPRPLADPEGAPRAVAALVVRSAECPVAADGLSQFYGMTPAEARLAALIVGGQPLQDAAMQLGISQNTARTHMKRIYAKTDTHRQVELVRLLGLPAEAAG